jgi:hypothetical protein
VVEAFLGAWGFLFVLVTVFFSLSDTALEVLLFLAAETFFGIELSFLTLEGTFFPEDFDLGAVSFGLTLGATFLTLLTTVFLASAVSLYEALIIINTPSSMPFFKAALRTCFLISSY